MHSSPCAHCSRRKQRSPKSPCPSRVGFRFWASPFPSRLANASGRIVFNMVLFMDWQFVSGCSPPRLSTTQFPSTTDSQCSVRWGLSPHGWRALSGALGRYLRYRRVFTFCTFMGRALLAHLPSEEFEKYFRTRNFNLSPVKRQLGLGKSNRG
jgi:hypothetical protein